MAFGNVSSGYPNDPLWDDVDFHVRRRSSQGYTRHWFVEVGFSIMSLDAREFWHQFIIRSLNAHQKRRFKEISPVFMSVFALVTAAVAPFPATEAPVLAGGTTNSMQRFASCFTARQDKLGRPWFFVPNELGGRISNEGAKGAANAYQIRFTEGAASNKIEAFMAKADRAYQRQLEAEIKRCW